MSRRLAYGLVCEFFEGRSRAGRTPIVNACSSPHSNCCAAERRSERTIEQPACKHARPPSFARSWASSKKMRRGDLLVGADVMPLNLSQETRRTHETDPRSQRDPRRHCDVDQYFEAELLRFRIPQSEFRIRYEPPIRSDRHRHRRLPRAARAQGALAVLDVRQRRRRQEHAHRDAAVRVEDDLRGPARRDREGVGDARHDRRRVRPRAA